MRKANEKVLQSPLGQSLSSNKKRLLSASNEGKSNHISSFTLNEPHFQREKVKKERWNYDHSKYAPTFSVNKRDDNGSYHRVRNDSGFLLCHKPRMRNSIASVSRVTQCQKYPLQENQGDQRVKDYLFPFNNIFEFSYYHFIKKTLRTPVAPLTLRLKQVSLKENPIKVKEEKSCCFYFSNNEYSINEDEDESKTDQKETEGNHIFNY